MTITIKKSVAIIALFAASISGYAQVGINTKTPRATFDVFAKSPADNMFAEGILAPRLSRATLSAKNTETYSANQEGAIVYVNLVDGSTNAETINILAVGYYYFNGTLWVRISDSTTTKTDKIVFSAEYAGASLQADGVDNLGFLTSNNLGTPSWMNYYSWSNTQTDGGTNDYDVVLRFTVPSSFSNWSTNAITLSFAGTTDASFTANVYKAGSATALKTGSAILGTAIGTWTTPTIANATNLTTLSAGDTGIIILKMTAKDVASRGASELRLGDITLNFTSFK